MEKQSEAAPERGDDAYSEAVAARFRLLSVIAVLRNGSDMIQADRDHLASLLERIVTAGEDANDVLIHPDGRARQRSLTELQKVLIALVEASERRDDPLRKRVALDVQEHVGAGSTETVRDARREYGQGVDELLKANDPQSQAVLEAIARSLTEKVKRKS